MDYRTDVKPLDLSAAPITDGRKKQPLDKRLYECSSCGLRITEKKLVDAGGLCPKCKNSMRLLGRGEKKHPLVGFVKRQLK